MPAPLPRGLDEYTLRREFVSEVGVHAGEKHRGVGVLESVPEALQQLDALAHLVASENVVDPRRQQGDARGEERRAAAGDEHPVPDPHRDRRGEDVDEEGEEPLRGDDAADDVIRREGLEVEPDGGEVDVK